jgi:nitrogen regulatory protein PII
MKKIVAIIRSSKFDSVKESLAEKGINFFTFYEVKGYGHQKGKELSYRGSVYDVGYLGRIKMEIVVSDEYVTAAFDAIVDAAHTGEKGDGIIMVSPLLEIKNIRSGKNGPESINA